MLIDIRVVLPGDVLVRNVYSSEGVLLLRAGVVITRKYKQGLYKFNIKELYIKDSRPTQL